jgi:hypothetical protein
MKRRGREGGRIRTTQKQRRVTFSLLSFSSFFFLLRDIDVDGRKG